ncbi:MAG: hypothetical protein ABW110_10140 [Steroidobacteraceae bacterium]
MLRARAEHTESLRRLPPETVDDFFAAQFNRICQPTRFGGYGMDIDVALEVIVRLARGCGSSGWVGGLMALHNWQVSMFPLAAQQEYWADSPDVFCSSGAASMGSKLTKVSGGYRLSGTWKFSSGADFGTWFLVMKPSKECFDWMLVPRSDYAIVDDWHVSGLCGTGSKDIVLNDVFIPEHRRVSFESLLRGSTPGGRLYDGPFYKVPFFLAASWGLSASMIGMLDGIIDGFEQTLVGRRTLITGESQVERVANQMRLAESAVQSHSAKLLMRHSIEQLREWGRTQVPSDDAEIQLPRRDLSYVAKITVEAANRLFIAAGSSSIYHSNSIQRLTRDINAAGTHAGTAWDEAAEFYGRARWYLMPKH